MKGEETKKKFAEALLSLAKKKDIDRITVREIAEYCQVSSQTFYNHFADKYELAYSIYYTFGNELKDRMMQGKCSFAGALQEILSFYDDHAVFVLNAMYNTSGADSFEQHTTASTVKAVENLVLARSRASKLSSEQSVHIYMYISSCLRMCIQWIETGKKIPAAILASHMVSAMPESLRPYLL